MKHYIKYMMTKEQLDDTQKVSRLCNLNWQAIAARPKVAAELVAKYLPKDIQIGNWSKS